MTENDKISMRRLRWLALLEATTLAVLVGIAVPLKHLGGHEVAVSVMGPVHGIAFIFYLWMVVSTASSGLLRTSEVGRLVISAFVPFAGFASMRWIARKEAQWSTC